MNGEKMRELSSVIVLPCKVNEPVTRCTVCYSRREIVANGRLYCLPMSGDPVTKKLEYWWHTDKSSEEECPFENLSMIPALAMCDGCLDLVTEVEKAEYAFKDILEVLWNRIKASEVLCGRLERSVVQEDDGKRMRLERSAVAVSALMEFSMTTDEDRDRVSETLEAEPDEQPSLDAFTPESPLVEVKEENCCNENVVDSILMERREPEPCENPSPPSPRRSNRPVRRVAEAAKEMIRKAVEDEEDLPGPRVKIKVEGKAAKLEAPKPSGGTAKAKKILRKIIYPQRVKAIAAQGHRTKNHTIVATRLPRKNKERKPRVKKENDENGKSSDPPSRVCPICGVMLKGSDCTLKKHISYVHNKEKVLECQFCQEKFEYHAKLYVHQAKVHNHRPERIMEQCELCGKVVRAKWCMKEHLLTVHNIEPEKEKVYCCDKCPKKYICLNKYKDHLNSHEGIRPYACPLCNVRMVRIDNLRQHAKRVHQRELRWRRGDDGVELVEVA